MSAEDLWAENAELRRRLDEAEETLRAIRLGSVDAVVVQESGAHRVYTLEGADRPYRLMVEQMQQGAATLQADGTIAYSNLRLAEMLRVPHERLVGSSLGEFVAPEDRDVYANLLWQGRTRSGRGEARLMRADGGLVPSYLTFNVLPEDCGAAIGVLVTDLTAQKHHEQLAAAEEALRESRATLAFALDSARVGDWDLDLLSDTSRRSARHDRCFGYTEPVEHWGFSTLLSHVHGEDVEMVERSFREAVAGMREWRTEFRVIWPDLSVHWVALHGSVYGTENGRASRMLGIVADITDRKREENDRRELSDRYTAQSRLLDRVVSSITDFVYFLDREGRFTFANKPLLELLGLPLEDVVGRQFAELGYPPALAAHLQSQIEQVVETGERVVDETAFTSPSGREGYYQYILSPVFSPEGWVEAVAGSTRDITERRRLEAEREQFVRAIGIERSNLAAVIEQAPSFFCVLRGPDHVFELANGRYYQLIGQREVIGKTIREALPELAGQGFFELLDRVYESGEAFQGNEVPVFLDIGGVRKRRVLNFVYQVLRGVDEQVNGVLVHGIDVTELVQSRESARRSEERFRTLFDSMDEGFCVVDMIFDDAGAPVDYRFVTLNPAFSKHTGLVDAAGRTTRELGLALEQHWYDTYGRVARTGEPIRFVNEAKGLDGRWFDVYAFRIGGAESRRVAILFSDISARRRVERALVESEQRFRHMADHAPVMVWVTDRNGECTFLSKSWYQFTGQSADTGLGFGWLQAVHPEDRAKVSEAFFGAGIVREPYSVEFRLRRADGEYRWALDAATPRLGAGGEFVGYIGSMIDITERKRAEDEREALLDSERSARSEAERAGRLKDEFLATLSHELRTPLNAVLGWAHILRKKPLDPDTLEQGLSVIDRNARIQAQLIADLLDMSRIISGKMRLDVQRVDVALVIEAALDSIRPAAEAKDVSIHSVLDPLAQIVHGDPARIQQIVWNLLSNAVKFTSRGGRVEVSLSCSGAHAEVSVSDTGKGIRPEFLPHVFERFRQADSSAAREHGGLGLGLAIVKQLVELHGGSVRVESDGEGRGSIFTVRLPIAAVNMAPAGSNGRVRRAVRPPCAQDIPDLSGLRILVVDDEPDGRELVKRVLEECGAEVVTAGTADEALAVVRGQPLDIILSDIGLPERDGYSFMAAVREEGGSMPAVALTAFARSEDRTRALGAGYQAHIAKPLEPAELLATVASLTHRTTVNLPGSAGAAG